MLLYHGTSLRNAISIIERGGIEPRGAADGNFTGSLDSNANAVYLTDAYPLYFAINALPKGETVCAILEIDQDRLRFENMNADEDVIEQAHRGRDDLPRYWSMERRTQHYRDSLDCDQYDFAQSLRVMGTCAHMGRVPLSAVTRICVIDTAAQLLVRRYAMNAGITIENYRFCQRQYRGLTKWLFDIPLEDSELPQAFDMGDQGTYYEFPYPFNEHRDGITMHEPDFQTILASMAA